MHGLQVEYTHGSCNHLRLIKLSELCRDLSSSLLSSLSDEAADTADAHAQREYRGQHDDAKEDDILPHVVSLMFAMMSWVGTSSSSANLNDSVTLVCLERVHLELGVWITSHVNMSRPGRVGSVAEASVSVE